LERGFVNCFVSWPLDLFLVLNLFQCGFYVFWGFHFFGCSVGCNWAVLIFSDIIYDRENPCSRIHNSSSDNFIFHITSLGLGPQLYTNTIGNNFVISYPMLAHNIVPPYNHCLQVQHFGTLRSKVAAM